MSTLLNKIFLLSLLILSCFQNGSGQERIIELRISPVQQVTGKMMIALYDNPTRFLSDDLVQGLQEPVTSSGEMLIRMSVKQAGNYAISVFHDTNDNGKLDTNMLGMPTEPYGFSNNARRPFGPPKYQDASFELQSADQNLAITLR